MAKELSEVELATAVKWGLLKTLQGKSFCQTGSMSTTRARIENIINALGGEVHADIRSTTDYLIVPGTEGYRQGSKYKAAVNKGKMVITEAQFCAMILPTVEELLGDSNDSAGRAS